MSKFSKEFVAQKELESLTEYKSVLTGEYAISNYKVPYFQGNISLDEAVSVLRLVEDMPENERSSWTIEELFQRDIDWGRVEKEIVTNYLKVKDKRLFFNSLTVALLPLTENQQIDDEYKELDTEFPEEGPFGHDEYECVKVGGVQLARRKGVSSEVAYLRWSQKRVFAATIDGQHRLASLKTLYSQTGLTAEQRNTSIPVIFLVLDERLGMNMPKSSLLAGENRVLAAVREIFIDLNKHAKEVSFARQILLDDADLESVCVRTLIADKTCEDVKGRIPLGLVNWKDDSVKFDKGPYLTSVSTLYQVVTEFLSVNYPKDPLDKGAVLKFAKSVDSRFSFEGKVAGGRSFADYVDYIFDDENPEPIRSLPREGYLKTAVEYFDEKYRPLIVDFFEKFEPYSEFWELSKSLGGIDGGYAKFNALYGKQKEREKCIEKYGDEFSALDGKLNDLKSSKWPFMVVWQKGALKAMLEAYDHKTTQGFSSDDEFHDAWVKYMNEMNARSIFFIHASLSPEGEGKKSYRIWEGISLNPVTLTIKWSNSSASKIRDLLLVGWYLYRSGESANQFIEIALSKSRNAEYPGLQKKTASLFKGYLSVSAKVYEDSSQNVIEQDATDRLEFVLKAMQDSVDDG